MKVTHLYSGNLLGGVERVLQELHKNQKFAVNLQQNFYLVYDGILAKNLKESGADITIGNKVRFSNFFSVVHAWINIISTIKKTETELLVCHDMWSFLLGHLPARFSGKKVVLWAHTDGLDHIFYLYLKFFSPDAIITCSKYLGSKIEKKFKPRKCETIYTPYDLNRFKFEKRNTSEKFRILFVGRFNPIKGIHSLIRAMSILKEPNLILDIVGTATSPNENEYLKETKTLITQLGLENKITIHLNSTEIEKYFKESDLYCQPNESAETFGLSFVEALASGIPVITTALGGANEILKTNNLVFGSLLSDNKPETVANAIIEWKNNSEERLKIAQLSSQRAEELCSPEKNIQLMDKIFREIINFSN